MPDEPQRPEDEFDAFVDEDEIPRRLYERAIPEVLKRVVERAVVRSVERLSGAPENIRDLIDDVKIPKEAAQYFYEQVDDTKKGVYRVVAKEIRDVIEHMNFADEIADVLTKLQFEVNTTIRFVPSDPSDEEAQAGHDKGGGAKGAGAKGGGAKGAGAKEGETPGRRSPSNIPRPKVMSTVVMKARDRFKTKPRTNPPPFDPHEEPPPPEDD